MAVLTLILPPYCLLQLVVEWTLVRGVARQMEAFKEGFNSVFPLSNMQGLFYPSEVIKLINSPHNW
jgi:E3 ubiquitin-protein ligase TRIP12